MKCWYHFYILSTAAIVLVCFRICKCSKTTDDNSLVLPDESSILKEGDDQLELDLISRNMPKLTLTDENGVKLELEIEKSIQTENKIPLQDATNNIKYWPKPKPKSKSSKAELGSDNDSNIFTSKVTYSDSGHSILKSLRKSKCQRQLKETNDCKSTASNIDLRISENDGPIPASSDSVDGLRRNNLPKSNLPLASLETNEPRLIHANNEKLNLGLGQTSDRASIADEQDGFGSTAILHPKSHGNNGQPVEFRDQLGLPDCSDRADDKRFPILVVSTLDGHISGIDFKNGGVLWTFPTGDAVNPLLSSSMSKIEVTSRGEWIRLIPSLDGGIYRFDGDNVEALPITADTLLHSSFKFNEDTIFTGGKDSEVIGIDPFTGNLIYSCNSTGCTKKFSTSNSGELLVIKRVSQTVRAIDPKTGNERWNFSVGMHEANVANSGCESLDSDLEFDRKSLTPLQFVLPEGLIIGLNEHSQMLWRQKMSSPIVSAWNLIKDDLEQIDLFSSKSVPALLPVKISAEDDDHHGDKVPNKQPSLYVGVHQKQLYIQQNDKFQKDLSSIIQRFAKTGTYGGDMSLPKIQWQPYLATALSRTPVIHHEANHHPLLLDYDRKEHNSDLVVKHKFDYPYDNGYYLYGKDESILNDSDHWSHADEEGKDYRHSDYTDESFANQIYYICFDYGPHTLWKLLAGMFAFGVFHFMWMRYYIARRVETMTNYVNDRAAAALRIFIHNTLMENPQLLEIIQRLGVLRLPAPPPPPPPPEEEVLAENPLESLQNSSQDGHETQRQDSNYSSRYTSDFEPICCLGKGGFGVVFQVKNTLDENEYAVKRIVLPKKESCAERVKREARALAKLNHTHIVRYYQSWLETPPIGWEKEADSWWKQDDAVSSVFLSPDVDETEDKKSSLPHTTDPVIKKTFSNSLSGVIKKLGYKNLPGSKAPSKFSVETVSDSDSSDNNNDFDDENCDSSDKNVSLDNEDSSETSDSAELKNNLSYCEDDDSVVIFQEESISQNNVLNVQSSLNDEDSIVFQDDACEDNVEFVKKIFSKELECTSMDPSNENNKIPISDPMCISNRKDISRYRFNSYCTGSKLERPTSLNLPLSSSDPGHSRLVQHLAKDIATPNPRTYLYIQMELCKKESLKEWLANNLDRDAIYTKILNFFNDIVQAVEYVHDRALMHRDLKPSNIFFSLDGEIKVGDFGLVTTIEEENDTVLTPMDDYESKKSEKANLDVVQRTLNAGTHLYMSPEQMCGKKYNYKIDIFSLGLIFFEMLVPFPTMMERNEVMKKARYQTFPEGFEEKYVNESSLLHIALHNNPEERPTTRGIRARKPLASLQKDLNSITPEEHFSLAKVKGHWRSHSGSFTLLHSSSVSSNT